MQLLNQNISIDSFFSNLKESDNSILMLDYDGTLAPFTIDRENALPYEGVPERLVKLIELTSSKIIIVSGRDIAMLKKLLPLDRYPELYGSHGGEYFSETEGYTLLAGDDSKEFISEVKKWAVDNSYQTHFESKSLSCAFHWRGKPTAEIEEMKSAIETRWNPEIKSLGMEMHNFDGGIEFKLSSVNKGNAVKKILAENDVSNAAIAYLGDDLTDEDAFEALGDYGLTVYVNHYIRKTYA
ncbi:MAG: trehalose-phosphatase, partial [Calditrichaeota bacterium]